MGKIKNWKKIEDGKTESWQNQVTGEEVVLEGAKGEWEVWNKYRNEALDASMPVVSEVFDNKEKARDFAIQHLKQNTGGDLEVRPVDEIIEQKLRSKTARHPKDSWGVRHDKQNEDVESFEDQPVIQKEVTDDGVIIYVSVYHFLTATLENDEASARLNSMFQLYMDNTDENYLQAMYSFTGAERAVNTSNHESLLSQTLQYVTFDAQESNPTGFIEPKDKTEIYDENYVLLQIHQGADLRGGYTRPVVLKIRDIDMFRLGNHDINAETTDENGERVTWYSDDAGAHWYGDMNAEDGTENWRFDKEANEVYYKPSGNKVEFYPSF